MRLHFFPFLFLAGMALAAEPVTLPTELGTLETIGVGSRTYDGVKVISRDAVGIKITHEGGTSRIAYGKLPHDLAARFSVNPEAAKAQLRQEAEEGAAHERAMSEVERLARQAKEEAKPKEEPQKKRTWQEEYEEFVIMEINGGKKPELTGKDKAARVVALRNYISKLEGEMKVANAVYLRRKERLSPHGGRYSSSSNSERSAEKNQASWADYIHRRLGKQKEIIDEAYGKIRDAKEEIKELEKED